MNNSKHIRISIFVVILLIFLASAYVLFVLQDNGDLTRKIMSLVPELLILVLAGTALSPKSLSHRAVRMWGCLIVVVVVAELVFFSIR